MQGMKVLDTFSRWKLPGPSHCPFFDRLQYAKTKKEGLGDHVK